MVLDVISFSNAYCLIWIHHLEELYPQYENEASLAGAEQRDGKSLKC